MFVLIIILWSLLGSRRLWRYTRTDSFEVKEDSVEKNLFVECVTVPTSSNCECTSFTSIILTQYWDDGAAGEIRGRGTRRLYSNVLIERPTSRNAGFFYRDDSLCLLFREFHSEAARSPPPLVDLFSSSASRLPARRFDISLKLEKRLDRGMAVFTIYGSASDRSLGGITGVYFRKLILQH